MHTHAPSVPAPLRPAGALQAGERPGRQARKSASRPAGSRPATSIVIRGDSPAPQGTGPTRGPSAPPTLTGLAVATPGHKESKKFQLWTFLWTFLWTSTAQGGVHDHLHTDATDSRRSPRLTVAEAGELLGISRAFAYELVARGELPVICLGRRRLVPKVALLALVGQTSAGDQEASDPL